MIDRLIVMFVLAVASFEVVAAETYRWEDEKGSVHYSDQLPPAGARNVTRTDIGGRVPPAQELPYRLQMAVNKSPVTLYVTDCGDPCDRARELLIQRGVPHTMLDATRREVQEALMALTSDELIVPVASIGGTVIKGFEEGQWNSALDAAGYPSYAMIEVTPYVPAPAGAPSDEGQVAGDGETDTAALDAEAQNAEEDIAEEPGLEDTESDLTEPPGELPGDEAEQ